MQRFPLPVKIVVCKSSSQSSFKKSSTVNRLFILAASVLGSLMFRGRSRSFHMVYIKAPFVVSVVNSYFQKDFSGKFAC